MDSKLRIKLYSLTIDCKEPRELGKFYAALLRWELGSNDEEYAWAYPPGTQQGEYPCVVFQRNADFVPPVWPDEPGSQQQMAHMDIAVDDLEKAVRHAVACGATVASTQYSKDWTVMIDPSGHPFCLCLIKHIFSDTE